MCSRKANGTCFPNPKCDARVTALVLVTWLRLIFPLYTYDYKSPACQISQPLSYVLQPTKLTRKVNGTICINIIWSLKKKNCRSSHNILFLLFVFHIILSHPVLTAMGNLTGRSEEALIHRFFLVKSSRALRKTRLNSNYLYFLFLCFSSFIPRRKKCWLARDTTFR